MMAVWDVEVKCQVELVDAHLLLFKSVDDRAKFEWRECKLLHCFWDLRSHCTWLQGDRHYRRMDLRNGKLGRHTDGELDS